MGLRREVITVAVVQSVVQAVRDPDNPESEKREKLQHVLNLIDLVQGMGRRDLLAFHEFPLSGFSFDWNRRQALRTAIDVPGEETAAIGDRCRKYDCYVELGCYGKIGEWPNHFMNLGLIIGPGGSLIQVHWKMRNMSGMGFSTTVHDVLDRYVEMYGWDAVFPIARTDIGNLAIVPEVLEPEIARVYAMKGAEIVVRYMTAGAGHSILRPRLWVGGGGEHTYRLDFQAQCLQGDYFGIFVNNALSVLGDSVFDRGAGASAIIAPNGHVLAEASTSAETVVQMPLDLARYREGRHVPYFPKELCMKFYEEYVPRFPPNMFARELPDSIADAVARSRRPTR